MYEVIDLVLQIVAFLDIMSVVVVEAIVTSAVSVLGSRPQRVGSFEESLLSDLEKDLYPSEVLAEVFLLLLPHPEEGCDSWLWSGVGEKDVEDNYLKHPRYGLDLVGKPLKSLESHHRGPWARGWQKVRRGAMKERRSRRCGIESRINPRYAQMLQYRMHISALFHLFLVLAMGSIWFDCCRSESGSDEGDPDEAGGTDEGDLVKASREDC
ncbi:hypothetical protein BHE74_00020351 [Ensete ventricosum]|nr:hypothetical protein BHE74_00020351 [Ensete ventricosum]